MTDCPVPTPTGRLLLVAATLGVASGLTIATVLAGGCAVLGWAWDQLAR